MITVIQTKYFYNKEESILAKIKFDTSYGCNTLPTNNQQSFIPYLSKSLSSHLSKLLSSHLPVSNSLNPHLSKSLNPHLQQVDHLFHT